MIRWPFPLLRISRRLAVYVVLFSSVITLALTAIQLYSDYNGDLKLIELNFNAIRDAQLPNLERNVWVADTDQIQVQLDGLVELPDLEYLAISINGTVHWKAGAKTSRRYITKDFPLFYRYRGKNVRIGTLKVVASLDRVISRLWRQFIIVILGNGFKTFLVSGFILYIFHNLVGRHLGTIVQHIHAFDMSGKWDDLKLDKSMSRRGEMDELDEVVFSLNQMSRSVQRAYATLAQSRKRQNLHRTLVPLAIIDWNTDRRITSWNPAAENIFGAAETEAIGADFAVLLFPHDVQDAAMEMQERIISRRTFEKLTAQNVTRDGRKILCEWYNTPLVDEKGALVGVTSIVADITQQEQAKDQQRQADASNRAKSDFLASMSHDLRSPLNSILGFTSLIQEETFGPIQEEHYKDYIENIHYSGHHLLSLVNDILDLSKIESDEFHIVDTDIQLGPFLADLRETFIPQLNAKNISFDIVCDPDIVAVTADERALTQIVNNLVSNAVKFMAQNGHLRIRCRYQTDDGLMMSVEDDGCGISAQSLARITDPFVQDNPYIARATEGTGLGLYICRRLIELHNGTMVIESEPDRGTTVIVTFPPERAVLRQDA